MELDLRPRIDFYGHDFPAGEHKMCIYDLVPKERRSKLRSALAGESGDPIGIIVDNVKSDGWDFRRDPYDKDTNPYMDKVTLFIYMKDGLISKQP